MEHGSFTPVVFSTFGGLGREATVFYSHLADLLSKKHSTPYTRTLSLLRCCISFSLLRSAILAISGNRSVVHLECPSTCRAVLGRGLNKLLILYVWFFYYSIIQHLCHSVLGVVGKGMTF